MLPINSALKTYVEELDRRNTYLHEMNVEDGKILGPDIDDKAFAKLLSFGVIIPYADAVSYDRKGILVVGEGGIGKSSLVKNMEKLFPETSQTLAFDSPTLYKPDNTERALVYLDDIGSNCFPFFVPFLYPSETDEFPIEYLIHLRENNRRSLREGDIQEAVNYMIFDGPGYPRTAAAERKMGEIVDGVRCFDFFKPRCYDSTRDLINTAGQIKELVE